MKLAYTMWFSGLSYKNSGYDIAEHFGDIAKMILIKEALKVKKPPPAATGDGLNKRLAVCI